MFKIEAMLGDVDGVNMVFTTTTPFYAGSLRVSINGLFIEPTMDNGWEETGPNEITFFEPPLPGDVVQASYQVG